MAPTQDEAFHEIQLNGKQLVFLFMAATVVSVVIFLCGVLVGRNVRTQRASVDVAAAESSLTPAPAPTPAEEHPAYGGLDKPGPKADSLKKPDNAKTAGEAESGPKTPPPAASKAEPEPASPPATATEKPATRPSATAGIAESTGQGFAVQIAAVNARSEADAMAKRLASKGYSAYVLAPVSGMPSVYRVRVGKFSTRREAESVAAKLQKEEQLKPWVTR